MAVAAKMREAEAAPAASLAEPQAPELESRHVQIDSAGQVWRNVLVRAPKGLIAEDVRNPKAWRRVQAVRQSALVKLDRLLILAFDESWGIDAIVKHATNAEVSLAILKVFSFRDADETLYTDGTLEVFWEGGGYNVRRCADKIPIFTYGFSSEGLAIDALKKSYTRSDASTWIR